MRRVSRGRWLGCRGLATAAVALGVVALSALPASAAASTTVDSPANGASYRTNAQITVGGTVTYGSGDSGTFTVTLTDPNRSASSTDGCTWTVDSTKYDGGTSAGSTPLSDTVDLSMAYPDSCGKDYQGRPADNGVWTVTAATDQNQSTTSSFTVAVPPAKVTSVAGTSPSPLTVVMTWAQNAELDTHAYGILDSGTLLDTTRDASSLCKNGVCGVSFTSTAGRHSFAVQAFRSSAPGAGASSDLTSTSDPVSVEVAPQPAGSPTPATSATPSAGPTASAAPTAKATGTPTAPASGTAVAPNTSASIDTTGITGGGVGSFGVNADKTQASALTNEFSQFGAPAGIDKLPPLPKLTTSGKVAGLPDSAAAAAGSTDDGEPTDQGTFKLSLGYDPETKTVTTTTVHTPLNFVADAVGLSPVGLWRSIAGSLLLLLAAAHVRRWARKPIE